MTSALPADDASVPALSALAAPSAEWDAFVRDHPRASIYHLGGWSQLAREVFGHRAIFLEARAADGKLVGVLPLVRQRSLIGNFATSMPFFNYGGALAHDAGVEVALMERAKQAAMELGCSYLELRDVDAKGGGWLVRTDKVTMVLDLPPTMEALSKRLGSKLRSQVKRAESGANVRTRTGGIELLDEFYHVFAHNMRDLGTPVYPKRFFKAILERFAAQTLIVLIEHAGRAGAAGFVVFDRGRAEIPWASCLAEAKPLGLNMKLYWEVLSAVVARGCTSFDFGRSTPDTGTYKFKKQWGAEPVQLHWHRWERHPSPDGLASRPAEGRLMRMATAAWQRLPVPVANLLGRFVSPGLPW